MNLANFACLLFDKACVCAIIGHFSPNNTIISDKQSHINKSIRIISVISLNIYKSLHFTVIVAVIAVQRTVMQKLRWISTATQLTM